MPYEIKRVRTPKNSFKVCKKIGDSRLEDKKCFSKKGLPYKRALAQMRAIIISEKTYQKKASKKRSKKQVRKTSKKMSKVKPIKPIKK